MRYSQPQSGPFKLATGNPLTRGAQAVIVASSSINVVTGRELTRAGTGNTKSASTVGIATNYRENHYFTTEMLPAIGTAPFVEIWIGYPTAKYGPKAVPGNTANEAKFLTGSSLNQIGIFQNNRVGNTGWGGLHAWSTSFNTSSDVLAAGKYVVLVAVRRTSGMELWRDGVLIQTFAQAPTSLSAQKMVIGSFLEDLPYWTVSSDTVMAARIQAEWSANDVKRFSANPWQLFESPQPIYLYSTAAGGAIDTPINPAAASIAITGYAPTVAQSAHQSVAPGTGGIAITGYAPSITQSVAGSINPATGAITVTGYAPTVTRTANQALSPAAGAITITGYAPTVFQGVPAVTPNEYSATIMRANAVNSTGTMRADEINQTANLL